MNIQTTPKFKAIKSVSQRNLMENANNKESGSAKYFVHKSIDSREMASSLRKLGSEITDKETSKVRQHGHERKSRNLNVVN